MRGLERLDRVMAAICVIAVAAVVIVLVAGPSMIDAEKDEQTAAAPAKTDSSAAASDAPDGKQIFADESCGSCHTLKAAGASGGVGPNLDETGLDEAAIAETVKSGRGAMPSFEDDLSPEEIAAVAAFVSGSGP